MTREQLRKFEKDLIKIGLENVKNIVLVKNGTTNGDVIKIIFPNMKVDISGGVIKSDRYTQFDLGWWNSPYK